MTAITALIPRTRHRTGRIVAVRCATCKTWRKPRYFTRDTNTCRRCPTGRYLATYAAKRR